MENALWNGQKLIATEVAKKSYEYENPFGWQVPEGNCNVLMRNAGIDACAIETAKKSVHTLPIVNWRTEAATMLLLTEKIQE